MKTIIRNTVYCGVIACFSLAARAGTVIQQEGGEIGSKNPKSKITMYLDAGKLRVDTQDSENKSILIFDANKQVMWMINPAENSYREMDKAQMDAMGQQMSKAMEQMQAQMANMPPEQRKMMEDMMKGKMGAMGGASAKPTMGNGNLARSGEHYRFSLVREIQLIGEEVDKQPMEVTGNVIYWKGFGRIILGEVHVKGHERKISLVRLAMGSDAGGDGSAGSGQSNGGGTTG